MGREEYFRQPAVAGRFYPADAQALHADVEKRLHVEQPTRALGVVAPHAGYIYSGDLAGRVFSRVEVPRRAVVLSPNHTGRGTRVSTVRAGAFRMPWGDVPIDQALAEAVLAEVPGARHDPRAHDQEHAVEVELPFLWARQPALSFVPIVLAGLDRDECLAVGQGLARAVKRAGAHDDVLVVASSDMSHYLDDETTRQLDRVAIEPMLALDAAGLFDTVERHDISMCGVLPATAMLAYAKQRGATRSELVGYATSGDAFGDRARVVGYAGVLVS